MSLNLSSLYAQQFATNIALLLQQKGSRLRGHVTEGTYIGKQASPVDQIGAVIAQKVVSKFAAMGRVDAAVDRRWVLPQDYDLPQLIDSFDRLRMLNDPKSAYVQNAMYAMGRAMDDEIITAFFGTNKTGETASTSTTFPSANQVAVNFGAAANTGLTVAKLREAKRLLMTYQVDIDNDPVAAVVKAKQHDNLLAEAQIISTDFNQMPVMVEGKVERFLGITIIYCERLAADGSGYDRIPVFAKSGMHLGLWNDIATDVSQRKDLQSLPWQVYATGTFGGTRLEENRVTEIKCA